VRRVGVQEAVLDPQPVERPGVVARAVPVVDTVGAGDALVAGLLSGQLDGLDTAERLDRAVTCGAFAVATRGDWEGLPTRADLPPLDAPPGAALR
jgi:2-dehydro-3-deoxygluconokinase